jgi:hypothetical protein
MERVFKLTVNGKDFGSVKGKADTAKAEFIKYVKGLNPDFNEAKDILEITDITPEGKPVARHKARDKSPHNASIDAILARHLNNMVATYGAARVSGALTKYIKAG